MQCERATNLSTPFQIELDFESVQLDKLVIIKKIMLVINLHNYNLALSHHALPHPHLCLTRVRSLCLNHHLI